MGGQALNGNTQRQSSFLSLFNGGRGEVLYKQLAAIFKHLMSKRIRYKVLRQGEECPKCKNPMERRGHKDIDEKVLSQPYFFSEWDYCRNCNHVQHYDTYKKWNNNDKAIYMKAMEEKEEQLSFLESL